MYKSIAQYMLRMSKENQVIKKKIKHAVDENKCFTLIKIPVPELKKSLFESVMTVWSIFAVQNAGLSLCTVY